MSAQRLAILGLHLEANAFGPPTACDDFRCQCWEEGEAITRLARAVCHLPSELPGFYARTDAAGPWTPVPILVASAPPGCSNATRPLVIVPKAGMASGRVALKG
jgi:microcystin degradation protein MlrC